MEMRKEPSNSFSKDSKRWAWKNVVPSPTLDLDPCKIIMTSSTRNRGRVMKASQPFSNRPTAQWLQNLACLVYELFKDNLNQLIRYARAASSRPIESNFSRDAKDSFTKCNISNIHNYNSPECGASRTQCDYIDLNSPRHPCARRESLYPDLTSIKGHQASLG